MYYVTLVELVGIYSSQHTAALMHSYKPTFMSTNYITLNGAGLVFSFYPSLKCGSECVP